MALALQKRPSCVFCHGLAHLDLCEFGQGGLYGLRVCKGGQGGPQSQGLLFESDFFGQYPCLRFGLPAELEQFVLVAADLLVVVEADLKQCETVIVGNRDAVLHIV